MKVNSQDIIDYLWHELPPDRWVEIDRLIREDEAWKAELEKWTSFKEDLNREKQPALSFEDMPNRYWSSFLPRVRERIDAKTQNRQIFKERFIHTAPSFALAALMLFFLSNVLLTGKKIDYLLDQYTWIRNLNTSEIMDRYVRQNVSDADDIIGALTSGDDDKNILADWEGSYTPADFFLDENGLTPDEQKELLQNLEKTTTF